ncbi:hypothetical protein [Cellulomonas hominis]|uniref:hypothetical protein n=1 Tax=Cellulomonas hominis TaxID=156981 RepID=UPI0014444B5B|nr:hypothetical protein [Cellulomonas hominis]NKY11640.1 hypothetical protein [Cellulomonas hominis]
MSAVLAAEWYWIRRRRALRLALVAAAALAVGLPLARWLSSDADLAAAIAQAEQEAADLRARGVDIPVSGVFVEPRYLVAEQLPVDTSAAVLALALVGFLAAALSVGAEWRTGTVRLSFLDPAARSGPAASRVALWGLSWSAVGAAGLVLIQGGLLLVGWDRGLLEGATAATFAWPLARGVLTIGLGALLGAGLASLLRSDTVVVVLLLLYVLVAEIVLLGLNGAAGYRSPGSILAMWVVSADTGAPLPYTCGGAPRCDELFAVTAGQPALYLVGVVAAAALLLAAAASARRPVWR